MLCIIGLMHLKRSAVRGPMRAVLHLVLVAACSCAVFRPAPRDLDGYYWLDDAVPVFDAEQQDWYDEEVTDCLRIKTLSNGRVAFQVNVVQTNAHSCTMTGVAEREGDAIVFRGSRADYPGGCELRIEAQEGRLVLHDRDLRCREHACGARAGLDQVAFPRANRKQEGPVCVDAEP